MSDETDPHNSWPLVLLALNAVGASAYVFLASHAWVIRQECEAGIHTTSGEPFVWFSSIAPVIAVFLLLNLTWGFMISMHRQGKTGRFWLASAAIWAIAAVIDFSHHQC